jgi:hypothetical protein
MQIKQQFNLFDWEDGRQFVNFLQHSRELTQKHSF